MRYDYTAIPAPTRGEKAKDAKTPSDRYAVALTAELNRMAADGWEYVRADVLPSEERSGLTSRSTVYHNLLIFRRPLAEVVTPAPVQPAATATPAPAPEPAPQPKPQAVVQPEPKRETAPTD